MTYHGSLHQMFSLFSLYTETTELVTLLPFVYRSVIIARLLYASSAWWGFTSLSDRQWIAACVRRWVCCGFCPPDLPTIDELVSYMDDKLFNCITSDEHHVLHQLLPPERPDCGHSLRPRRHELCLTPKSRLDELNFIFRMLYNDMYWTLILCYLFLCICYLCCKAAPC